MFSYDIQFITIVADNYLNNISISEDDINYRELLITMAKIIGRTDDKKLLFYCTKAYSIYDRG
jgi:hypothetical protein